MCINVQQAQTDANVRASQVQTKGKEATHSSKRMASRDGLVAGNSQKKAKKRS
jgi:hypothetical protein